MPTKAKRFKFSEFKQGKTIHSTSFNFKEKILISRTVLSHLVISKPYSTVSDTGLRTHYVKTNNGPIVVGHTGYTGKIICSSNCFSNRNAANRQFPNIK